MSNFQTTRYSLTRRPLVLSQSQFLQSKESQVLRTRTDCSNRAPPLSSIAKLPEKNYSEAEVNNLLRKGEQQLSNLREESTKQRRLLESQNNEYLKELVRLIGIISRHSSACEDYFRSQYTRNQSNRQDLRKDYLLLKDRLNEQRFKQSTLRKNMINPEGGKEHTRVLTLKKAYDITLTSNQKQDNIQFCRTSHSSQRRASIDSGHDKRKMSLKVQPREDKHRHCIEKMRKLEEALNREMLLRKREEQLLQNLNEAVAESEMARLNLKIKGRLGCY